MKTINKALGIASLVLALGCSKQPTGIEQPVKDEANGPYVTMAVSYTSGKVPLEVDFTAVAINDSMKCYEWDFDGDGKIDTTVQSGKLTNFQQHTYNKSGNYMASVRVTGKSGNKAEDLERIEVQ